MKKILLKLNSSLAGYPEGHLLQIDADDEGIPLDRYWRSRLRDAEIDNCVAVTKNKGDK